MSTTGYAYAPLVAEQSLIKCFSIKIKRSHIFHKERKRLHFIIQTNAIAHLSFRYRLAMDLSDCLSLVCTKC
ncbi:MAG: hypothetical protein V7K14_10385 [Nostoc sp.]|uniref:hypothetical protein n=1 Tax=Nostoc sp. TaxID=1180 RepID=UPI002FF808B6